MKIGPYTARSDAGRRRLRNEDSFACRPPLFVVADGMGGAQAGELASGLTVEVFAEGAEPAPGAAPAHLEALIVEANRRVFERSQTSHELAGMGTTVTAVALDGDRLAIGHVGDSRAYRVRDGALHQLTDDHSLVADLVRAGRLTPEEAELHPQRSVITRALGTDSSVDVDLLTVDARPGDTILLCSDGLTTMIDETTATRIVTQAPTIEAAARELVRAANAAGGEDNITVVLFTVVDDDWDETEEAEAATRVAATQVAPAADEDTLTGLEGIPFVQPDSAEVTRVQSAADLLGATQPSAPAPRRRVGPWATVLVALVLALVALLVAAIVGFRRSHFVGATDQGRLAVYQGVPWNLTDGVHLYRAVYVSSVHAAWLTPAERTELFDHELVSETAARDRVAVFERELVFP